jgi:hypothetical protein
MDDGRQSKKEKGKIMDPLLFANVSIFPGRARRIWNG